MRHTITGVDADGETVHESFAFGDEQAGRRAAKLAANGLRVTVRPSIDDNVRHQVARELRP